MGELMYFTPLAVQVKIKNIAGKLALYKQQLLQG
jgi:hypothetical protein